MSWQDKLDAKVKEESLHKKMKKKVRGRFGTATINKTNGAAHEGAKKTGREVKR